MPVLPEKVIVHPIVLLSVVDHYNRVAKDTRKRVVGILLGTVSGGRVDALSSFGLPFEEDERDPSIWFLDHDYLETMVAMCRKVTAKEKVIGWYSTGPRIRGNDQAIHDLVSRYCPNPVLTIVDVSPNDVEIPTEAYCAVDEPRSDGGSSRRVFAHVPSEIGALEAEEIGVEHLLRDVKDRVAPDALSSRLGERVSSIGGLRRRLVGIKNYLEKVAAGEMPLNQEVMRLLQETFNLLPDMSDPLLSEAVSARTNDTMLSVYLGAVVRAIVALHNLINNKIALREAEVIGDVEAEIEAAADLEKGKAKADAAKGKAAEA